MLKISENKLSARDLIIVSEDTGINRVGRGSKVSRVKKCSNKKN